MTAPNDPTGLVVATALLDAGCVTARTDEPFRLPSGWATPVYMDCRRIIAFPQLRSFLVEESVKSIESMGILSDLNGIVGCESSGIALAAWLADRFNLPLHFVRKRGGGGEPIAGALSPGDKVLLVDDLMAAGLSKLRFLEAVRAKGADVADLFVLFDYGTFGAEQLMRTQGVRSHALACWRDVLQAAAHSPSFSPAALVELKRFLESPSAWSFEHAGRGSN